MNPRIKKLLSLLFIVLSIAAVIIIAFANEELGDAWAAIARLDIRWLCGILLCWASYAFFETLGSWIYLRQEGFPLKLGRSLIATLVGFYYSNITPGAAGGQPMQINSLRKAGIPVGYGTMSITVRIICNQFMISLISLVLYLTHPDFVARQLGGAVWAVRIGWLINFTAVPLVLLAAFQRKWIQATAEWLIRLLALLRLIKNPDSVIAHLTEILDTYHAALRSLIHTPLRILTQLFCSGISILALFGSVIFVYHAFGLSGTSWDRILTISSLLFVSASYTPLPGASGAQEGGFMLYFRGIFTDGVIGLALLVWRFFTYYLFLLTGIFILILEKYIIRREKRASKA